MSNSCGWAPEIVVNLRMVILEGIQYMRGDLFFIIQNRLYESLSELSDLMTVRACVMCLQVDNRARM